MHLMPESSWPNSEPKVEGLLFKVSDLHESLQEFKRGIYIDMDYARKNPVLWQKGNENMKNYFVAKDPLYPMGDKEFESLMESRRKSGRVFMDTPIAVFAEWFGNVEETCRIFEETIDIEHERGEEPREVREIIRNVLKVSYENSIDLIRNIRGSYRQYWLREPSYLEFWNYVLYYSKKKRQWYSIVVGEDIYPPDWKKIIQEEMPKRAFFREIIFQGIGPQDDLNSMKVLGKQSFADEMISMALVEMSNENIRSAILHAVIGLESVSKVTLNFLLSEKFKGLDEKKILEAISKDLSVPNLSRIVYFHLFEDTEKEGARPEWEEVEALYQTRNAVVHLGQRKFKNYGVLRSQIIQVYDLIRLLERKMDELKIINF